MVFFLARASTPDVRPQPEEVAELLWLPFGEAADALTFESDRQVLRRAEALLAGRAEKTAPPRRSFSQRSE